MDSSKFRYSTCEKAIIKTLLYSDIFNFPLSKDELWQYLISSEKIDRNEFELALKNLLGDIRSKDGFYCLTGKEIIPRKIISRN